ncbi:hypothetical protein RE432_15040 [Pusillimonas sp. SM2304]|uniref:hypothetical protein n=1 Tax=Pusillimonas sp. SM2304 TaxID=3073241 RepID=UPI002874DD3F|nr:hypothetical protein [Pusillimonas sp. SM2304]MDS1141755.1 hypothetical protein [Pusillimonas sp. SM2304]
MKPAKRRNKRYTPRQVRTPLIVGAQLVLGPLERIVDQIANDGTVDVSDRGTPVFQDGDGGWHDTAAALEGVVWHLEMFCARHDRALPLQPLRQLHACLKYMIPITETLLAELQAALPVLQRAMALGDPDDQVSILRQARIKEQLEQQGIIHE